MFDENIYLGMRMVNYGELIKIVLKHLRIPIRN